MRERTTLTAIAVLVGLSLVPAVLIYWLFGTLSSADVSWASDKVKLGGPIAAFFAILLLLYQIYSRQTGQTTRESDVARPFVGRWLATSYSNDSGRTATSDVDAILTASGELALSGNLRDQAGKVIGDWDAKEVFCTPTSSGLPLHDHRQSERRHDHPLLHASHREARKVGPAHLPQRRLGRDRARPSRWHGQARTRSL